MDEIREKREELRRLSAMLIVAVLLTLFTEYCKLQCGLDLSGTKKTETIHVALYWASKLNKLSRLCFLMVILDIWTVILDFALVPVVVERIRRRREESDVMLAFGSIFLLISLSFLAYLRWLVVVVG